MLPDRSIEAEDAFLLEMASAAPELVQEAISAALEQRRPQLAARLVGVLADDPLDGWTQRSGNELDSHPSAVARTPRRPQRLVL